jgi:peptidoglycan/xylan/chitin deacetylase (PgdA/CDA1 family)
VSRALLLIPVRAAGWRPDGVVPLLDDAESATHAALCAAGISVQVMGASVPRFESVVQEHDFVVIVGSSEDLFRAVESVMQSTGGCLLRVLNRPNGWGRHGPRVLRRILLEDSARSLTVSRLPRRSRVQGWRQRLSFPSTVALRSEREDHVVARWGHGEPALLRRSRGRLKIWTAGFPPDHVDTADLVRLVGFLMEDMQGTDPIHAPVPGGSRAVVILLHDVEEPLRDDPSGLRSVREGTEVCLESEARYGFRATYNLVGTFAQQVEDLVRRMVAEGHEVASHGASHTEVTGLEPASLRREVEEAEERIGRISGTRIRGFRSPRSRWSGALLDLIAERGYLWNAEADPSPYPYHVPRGTRGDLLRVPVAMDDWDFVRRRASPRDVIDHWKREVVSAEERGCWVAIGSHPSVLGVQARRMEGFRAFLDWLSAREIRVMTLGEASAWWLARVSAAEGTRKEVGS